MDRESIIELQKIDCNCNDCKFMVRNFEKRKKYDHLYKGAENASYRINYGNCTKLNKEVSFIPNHCQLHTQECFKHRRETLNKDNYKHVLTFEDGKLISDKFVKIEYGRSKTD